MKNTARLIPFFLFTITVLLIFPKNAFATLSACSADVDKNSIDMNAAQDFNFTIANMDSSGGIGSWISISPPSGLTIQGDSVFTQYQMGTGIDNAVVITVTADSGGNASSGNWSVQMSDDGGSTTTTCTGNLGNSIIDNSASLPPQLTNVSVSNISDTTATISWTTNYATTGELDYGLNSSYGLTQADSNSSLSHSISLSSLNVNTTYHYDIKVTNDNGTTDLGDHTFTTAATPGVVTSTQTVTVTTTNTVTKTVTPTPTPTPIPDTTAPSITVSTDFSKPFLQSPQVSGVATDNKAVAKMDYSLDGGHNWLPVDTVTAPGKISTAFSFLPQPLDDGNYALQVRAIDPSNNIFGNGPY